MIVQTCGRHDHVGGSWVTEMPFIFSSWALLILLISIILLKVKVVQSCPTLWDPMDYRVLGILQTRILEWVAFPFSKGSSQLRDQTQVFHIAGRFFASRATWEAPNSFERTQSMILGHTHQLPACVWVLSHSAGFFTTEPPGKPSSHLKNNQFTCLFFVYHMAVLCSSLGVTEIGVCNSLWYHHWVEGRGPVSVQWHWTWSLSQLPLSEPSSPSSWRSRCPTLWSTEKPSY